MDLNMDGLNNTIEEVEKEIANIKKIPDIVLSMEKNTIYLEKIIKENKEITEEFIDLGKNNKKLQQDIRERLLEFEKETLLTIQELRNENNKHHDKINKDVKNKLDEIDTNYKANRNDIKNIIRDKFKLIKIISIVNIGLLALILALLLTIINTQI